MSEDFDFDFPFEVNYEKVFKTNSVLPMARLLAATLMENPYMTVGMYMQKARDKELALIMEISEDEEDERMSDLLLMAEMLARAEGVETQHHSKEEAKCLMEVRDLNLALSALSLINTVVTGTLFFVSLQKK